MTSVPSRENHSLYLPSLRCRRNKTTSAVERKSLHISSIALADGTNDLYRREEIPLKSLNTLTDGAQVTSIVERKSSKSSHYAHRRCTSDLLYHRGIITE
ncbi:hypothetical protein TNCV_3769321 [Trichonephila clavipes]|nr:hypothetical protein TNCV_3769321 [Trichonephila clavipes]